MKVRTLFTGLCLSIVVAVAIGLLAWNHLKPTEEQASAEQHTSTGESAPADESTIAPNPEQTGHASGNGIDIAYGDADQAAERPTETPTYQHQDIKQPTPQADLDRDNAQAVATEAITLYTSRTSATDTTYQNQLKPITTEALQNEIFTIRLKAFDGKYPIAVEKVNLGENIAEWGVDTPARYSHYATARVKTQDDGTFEVHYRVAATKTKNGWTVTDLAVDSWKRLS